MSNMGCEIGQIICANATNAIADAVMAIEAAGLSPVIVTDPPFNIGYHYKAYRDRMAEADYYGMLSNVIGEMPAVVVLYPEALHKLSVALGRTPTRVVSWVYPSNTARQHRDIGYYGITPDFKRVGQPYKNPADKRIAELIAQGKTARLYDWWEVNQVKNISKEKTAHPCQMPLKIMENIVGTLGGGIGVIDPFCGSGTTLLACKNAGVPFIGIDIDEDYCAIARNRGSL